MSVVNELKKSSYQNSTTSNTSVCKMFLRNVDTIYGKYKEWQRKVDELGIDAYDEGFLKFGRDHDFLYDTFHYS